MFVLREIFKNVLVGTLRWKSVEINQHILAHAVYSYFRDIERYKEFHATLCADVHKRAAFTIKWLVMCKPIQVMTVDRKLGAKYHLLANEIFAAYAGIMHLEIPPTDVRKNQYMLALVYKLHNRPVIAETLITEMYLLEQCANGGWKPEGLAP